MSIKSSLGAKAFIKVAPNDVEESEDKHADDAAKYAQILSPGVLDIVEQLVAAADVPVAHLDHLLVDAHGLLCLPLQVDLCRNGHVFCFFAQAGGLGKLVVLHKHLLLLTAQLF